MKKTRWSRLTGCWLVFVISIVLTADVCLGAPNPLQEKYRSKRISLGGDQAKLAFAGALLGAVVVGVFAYLYGREWWLERRFRQYQTASAGKGHDVPPAPNSEREPLVKSNKLATADPSDLRGMCSPSTRRSLIAQQRSADAKMSKRNGAAHANGNGDRKGDESASACGVLNVRAADDLHEIYVDGAFVGMTPAKLHLYEGTHFVEVKCAGWRSYRREMQVIAGAEASLHAILEKGN